MRFSQDARQRASGTGANRKITYTVYDDFGRVTRVGEATANFSELDPERSYPFENDASSWRSRMTYDGGDLVAGGEIEGGGPNYAQGRLTKAQENTDADAAAEVVHRYAYDHLGNVRVKQVEIEGLAGTKTLEYVYDLAGRITGIIYPDGAQARYAYDGAGRISRVGDVNGNTLATYTHTAAGNIDTHVVGQGAGDTTADGVVTGTYTYNPREWVTGIDYAGTFSSKLTYDHAGNITRQKFSHGGAGSKTADYAYDDLYRITGFDLTGGTGRDYAYDRSGNLKSMVTGSSRLTYNYSAGSTPNRLDSTTGTGGQTYAYNQNGWMTTRGANAVAYDYRGLTTGYGSARYLMDPDRRRVKKTVGTATTYYLRGLGGNVLAEFTDQTQSARYVYAGARRIARIAGDSASYYLADHLGSTRSLVDGEGNVTASYDYWPYGKMLASSGTGATHFRFTGHERDAESGLDYMLARSYAYDVGRFLRPDPMQFVYPGLSPYAYAANNPLKYVDPDGELAWNILTRGLKIANRAYDAAKKGKSLFKKDTWKDIGTDEIVSFVDNVSILADGVWDANDVFAVIDLATGLGDQAKAASRALRSTRSGGRQKNYFIRDIEAGGNPHTRFRRNPETGRIEHYQTFDSTGSAGGNKRFRGTGPEHSGVDPPLILEPKPRHPGGNPNRSRPARPDETPQGN
ncbi:MAG: hypothetical protein F4207_11080 [Gemmatimonadetes bacterium]|nr:hypothetical protein [Gemmatimonadota bacterium]MYG16948.1 hypothetical protein [Gemmatimonadota bacterium]